MLHQSDFKAHCPNHKPMKIDMKLDMTSTRMKLAKSNKTIISVDDRSDYCFPPKTAKP